jgi:dynactin complex subunit
MPLSIPPAPDSPALPPLALGDRVLVEPGREAATLLFLGSVDGTEGEWAGVQFDDVARGKHDGTHSGRRYFVAPGCSGAFVRLHKLRRGMSLLHALRVKYEQAR